MKLFIITKEKGKLCNFYSGLITCIIPGEQTKVAKLMDNTIVLQYSQYEKIGRYKNIKDPEKFKTIKNYINERFSRNTKTAKDVFILKLLDRTGSSQMWIHEKSL